MENIRQAIELADIFNQQATDFLTSYSLCPQQLKVFEAIRKCRTSQLGGHINRCDHCGYTRQAYNSCRDRHCPKCQFIKKLQWVDKLASNLPATRHFHIVFTIPDVLHSLFYSNQAKAYSLLMQAAGKTLMQSAARNYGGMQAGAVAILHTWGQTMVYHPHVHLIVPAGGFSQDAMEWHYTGNKFFLPVKALSRVFRGILIRMLESAFNSNELFLPKDITDFPQIKNSCYRKNWVVYCKKPFSDSDRLIQYLGNYTHRVAISNNRITSFQDGKVGFHFKDYRHAGLTKPLSLDANEFIRRFLQHVLPVGFCKIRYFGFMALKNLKSSLEACSVLIFKTTFLPRLQGLCAIEVWRTITGKDPMICPVCHNGVMCLVNPSSVTVT
jgi:hypothetical protein